MEIYHEPATAAFVPFVEGADVSHMCKAHHEAASTTNSHLRLSKLPPQLCSFDVRSNPHAIPRGLLILVRISAFNGARSVDLVPEFVSIPLLHRTTCRLYRRWLS